MLKTLSHTALVLITLILTSNPSFALIITTTDTLTITADTFSDKLDFSSTDDNKTYDYVEVINQYLYTHTLAGLSSPGFSIGDATLSLYHRGNSDDSGEVWFTYTGGNILIGELSDSTAGHDFVLNSWPLSQLILNEIESTNPWSLDVQLIEDTSGTDKLEIDYSILSGHYSDPPPPPSPGQPQNTSVPEPSTILLLASGLTGLSFLRTIKK